MNDSRVNDERYHCLLDAGFPVTKDGQGAVHFQDEDGKRETAYNDARRACDAKLAAEGLLRPTTTEQLRTEYAVDSALHACLVAKGFPLLPLPSEEVFVQEEGAFNILDATAPIDLRAAHAACRREFSAADAA